MFDSLSELTMNKITAVNECKEKIFTKFHSATFPKILAHPTCKHGKTFTKILAEEGGLGANRTRTFSVKRKISNTI